MKNGKQFNQSHSIGDETKFNQEYGNCLGGNTKVSVFDKQTNEYREVTLKELYKEI